MTLKAHDENGNPIDITVLKIWQRKQLFDKMCAEKERLFSIRHSMVRIRSLEEDGLATPGDLAPYQCPFCLHWHIGHKPWDIAVPYETVTEVPE
jgi:hypothetical protein